MPCKLCLADVSLKHSHVIPEFLYRPGYDEKGRLIEIEGDSGRKAFVQKGYREYLLCGNCEQTFSRLEKFFADYWYQTSPLPDPAPEGGVFLNVEYGRFKLFLLSILWRASVSSRDEFAAVRLGPFEEEARLMLLNADAGRDTRFQIFGCVYLLPETRTPCHGTIMPPSRARLPNGTTGYEFIFGGVGWFYIVSKQVVQSIRAGALSSSGTMALPVNSLSDDSTFTKVFATHLENARRRR